MNSTFSWMNMRIMQVGSLAKPQSTPKKKRVLPSIGGEVNSSTVTRSRKMIASETCRVLPPHIQL
jgi:hypothetical protein